MLVRSVRLKRPGRRQRLFAMSRMFEPALHEFEIGLSAYLCHQLQRGIDMLFFERSPELNAGKYRRGHVIAGQHNSGEVTDHIRPTTIEGDIRITSKSEIARFTPEALHHIEGLCDTA